VNRILLVVLVSLIAPSLLLAEPIQWNVAAGGNGHWYEYFEEPVIAAELASISRSLNGVGYAVSVTSAAEENWILSHILAEYPVWLGTETKQPDTYPIVEEIRWYSGETSEYRNWETGGTGCTDLGQNGVAISEAGWRCYSYWDDSIGYILEYPSPYHFGPILRVADTPTDQGGFLDICWNAFPTDATGLPDSIATYDTQRFEAGTWTTLTTIAAAQADSYQVTVPTPDIFTFGQSETISQYRVVANSSNPAEVFFSSVDSAYSTDNLAPPKPEVVMHESDDFRIVISTDPAIPDLEDVCFYRGSGSGFDPVEPIQCSMGFGFQETQLNNYYYRVQFTDIHGNKSEFSDEISLQFPSEADISMPLAFALKQNHPNPFNPSTTISFTLPSSSPVSLRIYDVAGKLVRDLISGQTMQVGNSEAVWDGKDYGGKSVSAGVYFYRLNAGEFSETKRMALVK